MPKIPSPAVLDSEDEVDKLTAQWLASPSSLSASDSKFYNKTPHTNSSSKGSARRFAVSTNSAHPSFDGTERVHC